MENSFGQFLKQKRLEKNLTQKELAKRLNVTESAVSKWEKDVAHPDITLLPTLSALMEVSEHELITASIDNQSRKEKIQAKKWRTFSLSWSLFFYISYAIALIPCFICNLAIDKTLSWFWIVFFSLLLAFTFTNLPKLIKKHKLVLVPLSMFLSLCLLLGCCAIYTKGDWFLIASLSVLVGLTTIFCPIYISKYKIFAKVKKHGDYLSLGIIFILLNILLIVIDIYSVTNSYASKHWYFGIALPISLSIYLFLNLLLSVKFLKVNSFIKTAIVLFVVDLPYLLLPIFKSKNPTLQEEINSANIFKANFSNWTNEISLERNIHCILALTIFTISAIFLVIGLIRYYTKHKRLKNTLR